MLTSVLVQLAAHGKPSFLVSFLRKRPELIRESDSDGNTLLMHAARKGNEEMCRFLIEQHSDLMALNRDGKTAQDLAKECGRASPSLTSLLEPKITKLRKKQKITLACKLDGSGSKSALELKSTATTSNALMRSTLRSACFRVCAEYWRFSSDYVL